MIILANVMIPTIAEHFVVMLFLLLPVAMIEALVLGRRHLLKYSESFNLAFLVNFRSTMVGLPMGYVFALVGLIPAGLFAGLLPEHISSCIGVVIASALLSGGMPSQYDDIGFYLGTMLVMIPYLLVTMYVERKYLILRDPKLNTPALLVTVRIMNCITYGLLAVPLVVGAILAMREL